MYVCIPLPKNSAVMLALTVGCVVEVHSPRTKRLSIAIKSPVELDNPLCKVLRARVGKAASRRRMK